MERKALIDLEFSMLLGRFRVPTGLTLLSFVFSPPPLSRQPVITCGRQI